MSIDRVTGHTEETVGMINAARWSYALTCILTGASYGLLGWKMAFFFLALALIVRIEGQRVRVALWAECYNAMRWTMEEHGFKFAADPQIYKEK